MRLIHFGAERCYISAHDSTNFCSSSPRAAVSACSQPPRSRSSPTRRRPSADKSRILAVKTLVIEGEGTNGNLGQDMTMDAASQQFVVSGYKRSVDVVNLRARTEQTRTPNFAYFQGPQAQKQVLGVDGDVGYNVAPNGNATRVSNAVAKDRRAEIYHHPIKIVRAALDPEAKLDEPAHRRQRARRRHHDRRTASSSRWRPTPTTNLPTRVVSMTDNTESGRRGDRNQLRRLPGRRRSEAAEAADDEDRQHTRRPRFV